MVTPTTQRERLRALLDSQPIVRAYELRRAGIAAATISRAVNDGELIRISRGLYQRTDNDIDTKEASSDSYKYLERQSSSLCATLDA